MSIMRCRHRWEIVSRTFNPPAPFRTVKGIDQDALLTIAYGITVIEQRCTLCGLTDTDHTPGEISP